MLRNVCRIQALEKEKLKKYVKREKKPTRCNN
jgi:hypothetical protein